MNKKLKNMQEINNFNRNIINVTMEYILHNLHAQGIRGLLDFTWQ